MDNTAGPAENNGVIQYLKRVKAKDGIEDSLLEITADPRDTYLKTETHPEVGNRLWHELASALPSDCRQILSRTPTLVHPQTSIIFALALGTQYCLRLPPAVTLEAEKAGARTTTRWSDGSELDLDKEFGPNWVFGRWLETEALWCRMEYDAINDEAQQVKV